MKLNEYIKLYTPDNLIEVPAKRVYIGENIKTYLHRPIGATEGFGWTISEYTTGLAITNGQKTQKAAMEKAEENIKKYTIETILNLINNQEVVNV